ncbi:NUDIX hydrolase domain-like protein [Xylariaceae sp. FL1019]|nr:NUDIX hydrolase domain-like protein [Xylariaceae sp. FL1019]
MDTSAPCGDSDASNLTQPEAYQDHGLQTDISVAAAPQTDSKTAALLQNIGHDPSATATEADLSTTLPADLALSLDHQLSSSHPDLASYYWDASTMAPLNKVSAAAIARLRAYKPPAFPTWDRLPVTRRAAVLILLFADRMGDLRVVITMRAASLRSFSGHAAFPGGKADSLSETPYQVARREAWEEIGLPMDDRKIPAPFRIEPLCNLPCSLAKTELAVRPCVAFLHAEDRPGEQSQPTVDEAMMPKLDAKEVAAVFSAPFHNFLSSKDEPAQPGAPPVPPGHWYDGKWLNWKDFPWRSHSFYVPVNNQRVQKPKNRSTGQAALVGALEQEEEEVERFMVWGMTGRMLVDAARVAYGREPEFEHNTHFGDEDLLAHLESGGQLKEKEKKEVGLEATKEEVKDAKI